MNTLVPKDFSPPKFLETSKMRLRCLTVNDVVKDYDAVMSSMRHLQKTIPFGPEHNWPTIELTFEQDLIDLGWHQKEFQKNSSFAYTVMSLDETKCLGCVYIYPSLNARYDAKIVLWAREDEVENGLDEHLFENVKKWITEEWPFKNPGYPGRLVTWEQWQLLV